MRTSRARGRHPLGACSVIDARETNRSPTGSTSARNAVVRSAPSVRHARSQTRRCGPRSVSQHESGLVDVAVGGEPASLEIRHRRGERRSSVPRLLRDPVLRIVQEGVVQEARPGWPEMSSAARIAKCVSPRHSRMQLTASQAESGGVVRPRLLPMRREERAPETGRRRPQPTARGQRSELVTDLRHVRTQAPHDGVVARRRRSRPTSCSPRRRERRPR